MSPTSVPKLCLHTVAIVVRSTVLSTSPLSWLSSAEEWGIRKCLTSPEPPPTTAPWPTAGPVSCRHAPTRQQTHRRSRATVGMDCRRYPSGEHRLLYTSLLNSFFLIPFPHVDSILLLSIASLI